jgi:hypothetical protein
MAEVNVRFLRLVIDYADTGRSEYAPHLSAGSTRDSLNVPPSWHYHT